MTTLNYIRSLTITATTPGVDPATSSLNRLATAHDNVAAAAGNATKVTETSAKGQLSMVQALERTERRFNATLRAQQDFEKVQRDLNRVVAQHPELQGRVNTALALAAEKFGIGKSANDNFAQSVVDLLGKLPGLAGRLGTAAGEVGKFAQAGTGAVTPLGLIVTGLGLATTAYAIFADSFITKGRTLDEMLTEQARLLDIIKNKYGEVGDAAARASAPSREVAMVQVLQNQLELRQQLEASVRRSLAGGLTTPTSMGMPEMGIAPDVSVAANQYKAFAAAIEDLQTGLARGRPDLVAFNDAVAKIGLEQPRLHATASALLELTKPGTDIANKVQQLEDMRDVLTGIATEAQRARLGLQQMGASPEQTFGETLQKLIDMAPKANEALIQMQKVREAELAFNRGVSMINRSDMGPVQSADALKRLSDALRKAREEIQAGTKDGFDRAADAMGKHIAAVEADAAAVGLGVAAHQRLRSVMVLTEVAQRDGAATAAKYAERIKEIADRAGAAAEALAKAQIKDQIKFGQDTALLSQSDVQIAQQLKGIYPDVATALDSVEAAQMRLNNAMKSSTDMAVDFGKSLVGGLLEGKSAADALNASLNNVAQKLANKGVEDLLLGALSLDPAMAAKGATEIAVAFAIKAITGDAAAKKAAEEKQRKAWEAWHAAGEQFRVFIATANGQSAGTVQTSIAQIESQGRELWKLRSEAVGFDNNRFDSEIIRISQAVINARTRLIEEFKASFVDTLAALDQGLGPDSPFFAAIGNVKKAAETMKALIADTQFAFGSDVGARVDAVRAAAQGYLLTLIGTEQPLTDVHRRMLEIDGAASELQRVLESLGMSATDAAVAIEQGVVAALDALRSSFVEGLQRDINEATGRGFLNQIADLLATYTANLADAAMLGVDPALVFAAFQAQAQQVVDQAGLVGEAFAGFIEQFPELADVVTQSQTALADAAADAAAELARSAAALDSFAKDIQNFLNELTTGSLSILSPQDKLAAAQSIYQQQLALAQAGDSGAMSGGLTSAANELLTIARDYYASSADYAAIFMQIQNDLAAMAAAISGSGMAAGGVVTGGRSGVDSVPALLMPNEFVVNARAAIQNRSLLEGINSGRMAHFAHGGWVGGYEMRGAGNDNTRQNFADLARTFVSVGNALVERLERVEQAYRDGTRAAVEGYRDTRFAAPRAGGRKDAA